jgi:hypothetical protein
LKIMVCPFVLFLLSIVHALSVLLRFTNSDYPFGIFKLLIIGFRMYLKKTIYIIYINLKDVVGLTGKQWFGTNQSIGFKIARE